MGADMSDIRIAYIYVCIYTYTNIYVCMYVALYWMEIEGVHLRDANPTVIHN